MTSHLPSPPSSRPSSPPVQLSPSEGQESLSSRLDTLLERYLVFLDQYTSLRTELSASLSAGFFALAQANRNATSTLGAGRRYGEEGFDVRMKARRMITIQSGGPDARVDAGAHQRRGVEGQNEEADEDGRGEDCLPKQIEDEGQDVEKEREVEEDDTDQEPCHSRHRALSQPTTITNGGPSSMNSYTFSTTFVDSSKDPLKWYGILVPPALRTCQSQFTSAASSSIPSLVSTVSILRGLEDEIWSLRKELNLLDEYVLS